MQLLTILFTLLFSLACAQDVTVTDPTTSTITYYTTCTVQQVSTTFMTKSAETTTVIISAKVYPSAVSVASANTANTAGALMTGVASNGTISSATQPAATFHASPVPYNPQSTSAGVSISGAQSLFAVAACLSLSFFASW